MKIPVLLVTGFLGSGKTTLLKAIATKHPDLRMVFLVNEFAENCVDAVILSENGQRVHSVMGGSIFCECKAGEFVRVLREKILQEHTYQPLDAVVIETSGIANPEAIGKLISDPVLSADFDIRRIVTVVSPPKLPTLIENLPVVRTQIKASDLILVNKVDLCSEEVIARADEILKAENPMAEIMHTSRCDIQFNWTRHRVTLPAADLATFESNPFATEIVHWLDPISDTELEVWLRELPSFVLRAKGYVETLSGWKQLDRTVDQEQICMSGPNTSSSVTLIVHGDHKDALQKHLSLKTVSIS